MPARPWLKIDVCATRSLNKKEKAPAPRTSPLAIRAAAAAPLLPAAAPAAALTYNPYK